MNFVELHQTQLALSLRVSTDDQAVRGQIVCQYSFHFREEATERRERLRKVIKPVGFVDQGLWAPKPPTVRPTMLMRVIDLQDAAGHLGKESEQGAIADLDPLRLLASIN
jgi:hypothetical protein